MSELNTAPFGRTAGGVVTADTNRVLRNTYFLLALSMVPTALGAMLGIQFGFFTLFAGSPILSFVVMLAAMFGFIWGIQRNQNNGFGVVLLLGFTGWLQGTDRFWGNEALRDAHESLADGLIGLAGLHAAAAIVMGRLERTRLVKAMITGVKERY